MSAGFAGTDVRALLLDIEGTTTPITFVSEVLFPFARARLRPYLEQHGASPEVRPLLQQLRDEHAADTRQGLAPPAWPEATPSGELGAAVAYLEWLMDRDRKSTPLKALQGRIWEDGYRDGQLQGEVFTDVPPALARWRQRGLGVGIFSSGSVLAQRLLFRHSRAGDLTPFLRWHFDTTLGPKVEAASYARIAEQAGVAPHALLFVSDITRELDAARAAGVRTVLSLRPGNAPQPAGHGHPSVHGFDALPL